MRVLLSLGRYPVADSRMQIPDIKISLGLLHIGDHGSVDLA